MSEFAKVSSINYTNVFSQTAFPPIETATASLTQNQHFIFSLPLEANKELAYMKRKTKQKE